MFKVQFSVIHEGCLVNEMSRHFPKLRFICPGGFILGAEGVEELIVLDQPSDGETQAVIEYLSEPKREAKASVVERTRDKAYIVFTTKSIPKTFCSQVVERNRGFRIGMEIQEGGLEKWHVGCHDRRNAEKIIQEIATLGQLKESSITEESWAKVIDGDQS